MRRRISSSVLAHGGGTEGYLVRLICSFSHPEDILAAYLHRPLVGDSFRRAVEQLAKGTSGRRHHSKAISDKEIAKRAQAMLRWLDGKEPDIKDPYEVLGLSQSAGNREILHRYRTLSKRVHPDRHPLGRQDYWTARQDEVNQAYRTLTDPESRARWQARVDKRKQLLRRLWKLEKSHAR